MRTDFNFTPSTSGNIKEGYLVWPTLRELAKEPDLPLLNNGMDITVFCNVVYCKVEDINDSSRWNNFLTKVSGKIASSRVAVSEGGDSMVIYSIALDKKSMDDIKSHIEKN